MWIIQKNAVSDEQQDSFEKLETRLRLVIIAYAGYYTKTIGI
jgi:hypothetical protein